MNKLFKSMNNYILNDIDGLKMSKDIVSNRIF